MELLKAFRGFLVMPIIIINSVLIHLLIFWYSGGDVFQRGLEQGKVLCSGFITGSIIGCIAGITLCFTDSFIKDCKRYR